MNSFADGFGLWMPRKHWGTEQTVPAGRLLPSTSPGKSKQGEQFDSVASRHPILITGEVQALPKEIQGSQANSGQYGSYPQGMTQGKGYAPT